VGIRTAFGFVRTAQEVMQVPELQASA
jgi:hypothetical protein